MNPAGIAGFFFVFIFELATHNVKAGLPDLIGYPTFFLFSKFIQGVHKHLPKVMYLTFR